MNNKTIIEKTLRNKMKVLRKNEKITTKKGGIFEKDLLKEKFKKMEKKEKMKTKLNKLKKNEKQEKYLKKR